MAKKNISTDQNALKALRNKILSHNEFSVIKNEGKAMYANGAQYDHPDYYLSDYMTVKPLTTYTLINAAAWQNTFTMLREDKSIISVHVGEIGNSYAFVTPIDCVFLQAMVTNTFISPQLVEGDSDTYIISKTNGNFSSFTEALSKIYDSAIRRVTLIVMPGVYNEQCSIRGVRNISIIGVSKKDCILIDRSGEYWKSPLEISGNSYIANMTIIADSTEKLPEYSGLESFAVHADFAGEGVCEFYNCDLIAYQHAPIGIGLHNNQTIILDACGLYNHGGNSGAILAHNNQFNDKVDQKLIVKNCYGIVDSGIVLELTDANLTIGDGGDAHDTVFSFYNNMFYSKTLGKTEVIASYPAATGVGKIVGNIALSADSYGNNLAELNA